MSDQLEFDLLFKVRLVKFPFLLILFYVSSYHIICMFHITYYINVINVLFLKGEISYKISKTNLMVIIGKR